MVTVTRILLFVASAGLFVGALVLFGTGGTTRLQVELDVGAPSPELATAEVECDPLARGLFSRGVDDHVVAVGDEEGSLPGSPTSGGNDLRIGQACGEFRDARSAAIGLLAVPSIIAGAGGFALQSRRK